MLRWNFIVYFFRNKDVIVKPLFSYNIGTNVVILLWWGYNLIDFSYKNYCFGYKWYRGKIYVILIIK